MGWYNILSNIFICLNFICAMYVVYTEPKNATTTWAWLMVLLFLPVIGFFIFFIWEKGPQIQMDDVPNTNITGKQKAEMKQGNDPIENEITKEYQP